MKDGELQKFDYPGAVQTEIWGISDSTGALTGNYIDDSGIRRGFSGDEIIEFPGALETYADFVNASGGMVGSYVDAEGTGLTQNPFLCEVIGRWEEWKVPHPSFSFPPSVQNVRIERQVRKS